MTHRILRRAGATFFVMAAGALVVAPNAPAQNQKWVPLFNGKNLDGWVPKFTGFDLGVNYNDTFSTYTFEFCARRSEKLYYATLPRASCGMMTSSLSFRPAVMTALPNCVR